MENLLIKITNLNKKFKNNHVLKGLSFSIQKNERIAIVGGNGAGKTTLLNILSKNDNRYTGIIENNLLKKEMSFQFQNVNYSDEFSIYDILSIFEYESNAKRRKEIIFEKLDSMNLLEHSKKRTHELSGGQLQKLNLLLTIATKPKLIFFDEIVSGLDQPSIEEIFKFIKSEVNGKITTITVSHNPKEIFTLCDRVIFLREGNIIMDKKMVFFKTLKSLEDEMKKQIIFNDVIDYKSLMRDKRSYRFLGENAIEVNNLTKSYELNKVLKGEDGKGINFTIKQGERIALIGKNGSGKSTFSEIISGVLKPTKGNSFINVVNESSNLIKKIEKNFLIVKELKDKLNDLLLLINKETINTTNKKIELIEEKLKYSPKNIDNEKLNSDKNLLNNIKKQILKSEKLKTKIIKEQNFPRKKASKERGMSVGIQFQKQYYPSTMSIRDVVIYNLQANKISYDEDYINVILKSISLEEFTYKSTFELSGGQRQKLNIILTIIKQPSILILDELTTGLDLLAKEKLTKLITQYLDKTNSTLLMVTHSHEDIENLTNKVIVLNDGCISKEIDTKNMKFKNINQLLMEV